MLNHIYKLIELVGPSTTGTDDAIRNAIETAALTLRTSTGSRSWRCVAMCSMAASATTKSRSRSASGWRLKRRGGRRGWRTGERRCRYRYPQGLRPLQPSLPGQPRAAFLLAADRFTLQEHAHSSRRC